MQTETQTEVSTPSTDIALLPPAERAVLVLDATKTEARLRELVAASADITEVKEKDGREQAHRTAMVLRNARVAIEKTGKAARDDANQFSKAVIAKEKELVAIVQPEEDRVLALRDRYDAEQARIKAEAERKEAERKARIQGMITAVRNIPVALAGKPAEELASEIAELEAFKAGEEFGEFDADADAAALTALATLRDMYTRQVAAEAEAARVAAERAELERQRAEAEAAEAERQRVAAETKRQLEAQQAALAAERKAEADRLQAEREAFEAERRAFEEQKAAAAREAEAKAAPAAPVDTTTSTITVVENAALGADATLTAAIDEPAASIRPVGDTHPASDPYSGVFQDHLAPAADLPPDEADEAAEAALRARVECLNMAVGDLLVMGCTADNVRELVDLAIVAAGMKEAA